MSFWKRVIDFIHWLLPRAAGHEADVYDDVNWASDDFARDYFAGGYREIKSEIQETLEETINERDRKWL